MWNFTRLKTPLTEDIGLLSGLHQLQYIYIYIYLKIMLLFKVALGKNKAESLAKIANNGQDCLSMIEGMNE